MTQLQSVVRWLVPIALLASACGGGDEDRDVLPLDRYCEARAATCESLVPCCEMQGGTSDVASCREAMIADCDAQRQTAVESRGTYHSNRAAECVLELDAWFSACEAPGQSPAVCEEVFQPSPSVAQPLLSYCELIATE